MNNKCLIILFCFLAQNVCGMAMYQPSNSVYVSPDLREKGVEVPGPKILNEDYGIAKFNLAGLSLYIKKNSSSLIRFCLNISPQTQGLVFLNFKNAPKAAFLSLKDTEDNDQIIQAENYLDWEQGQIRNKWETSKRSCRKLIFGGLAAFAGFGALTAKVPNDNAKIAFASCAGLAALGTCVGATELYELRKFFRTPSVPRS